MYKPPLFLVRNCAFARSAAARMVRKGDIARDRVKPFYYLPLHLNTPARCCHSRLSLYSSSPNSRSNVPTYDVILQIKSHEISVSNPTAHTHPYANVWPEGDVVLHVKQCLQMLFCCVHCSIISYSHTNFSFITCPIS